MEGAEDLSLCFKVVREKGFSDQKGGGRQKKMIGE